MKTCAASSFFLARDEEGSGPRNAKEKGRLGSHGVGRRRESRDGSPCDVVVVTTTTSLPSTTFSGLISAQGAAREL